MISRSKATVSENIVCMRLARRAYDGGTFLCSMPRFPSESDSAAAGAVIEKEMGNLLLNFAHVANK